jgi:tRNA(adenine34) deaminase
VTSPIYIDHTMAVEDRAAVRLGLNAPGETKMMGAHGRSPLPTGDEDDAGWMRQAILLAQRARDIGEVPVGAVLVREGEVLSEGWNCPITRRDPSAHAEVMALRAAASRVGNYRLPGATLYVTLEPCVMCAGAILHARLARVVFGAPDPKGGAAGSVFPVLGTERLNHRVEVQGGCLGEACGEVLQSFFQERRRDSAGPSG